MLFPLLLHIGLLLRDALTQRFFFFNSFDICLLIPAIGYGVCAWLTASKLPSAAKLAAFSYGILALLLATELTSFVIRPKVDPSLPCTPMRRESQVGNALPGITGKVLFTVNKYGVRAPDWEPQTANSRILCVGGSSVECLYNSDSLSWPWKLGEKLSVQGKKVYVANAGKSGLITAHHEFLLRNYKHIGMFETVIVMCGVNDAGAMFWNNYAERIQTLALDAMSSNSPTGPYYRNIALTQTLRGILTRRGLVSATQDATGDWINARRAERKAALARNTIKSLPATIQEALERYRRDVGRVIAVCRKNGQRLILLTQPTIYSADMTPETEALLWGCTSEGAYTPSVQAEVMNAFNLALIETAKEEKIECYDLASQVPHDAAAFYDDCHFNTGGCEQVASLVADYLQTHVR